MMKDGGAGIAEKILYHSKSSQLIFILFEND